VEQAAQRGLVLIEADQFAGLFAQPDVSKPGRSTGGCF
jgi:hypothetical protein